jgi:putative transposase
VVRRDADLLPRVQALKAEPPCWGDRRIWAYRRGVAQLPVNKQRIWRLRREPRLRVPPNRRLQAKRTPTRSNPRPIRPQEWWGIDRTKVLVEGVGWLSLVLGLDGSTQVVVGHDAGRRGTAQHGLQALDMAVNRPCPQGARGQGVSLMGDHGCQPTSTTFLPTGATLESPQAFTRDHHPKGQADPERFMRTRTEECLWLHEWSCPLELMRALKDWLAQDNEQDLPSAWGDHAPRQGERNDFNHHSPPFVAA